jgi:uncharacterized protein YbjQ (UPF0145 family)
MIITTCDGIPGKKIVRTLGMVRGNTVRCRHLGRDIMAFFRGVIGGEIGEYTKMLAESREQSLDRMASEAQQMGANAIITLRFATSSIMTAAAELLAYGTAVIIEDEQGSEIE